MSWLLAFGYGVTLFALNLANYVSHGKAGPLLAACLAAFAICAVAQMLLFGFPHVPFGLMLASTSVFLTIALASIPNTESDTAAVYLITTAVLFISSAAAANDTFTLKRSLLVYGVFTAGLLVFVIVFGEYRWGRLFGGDTPNAWGRVSLSVFLVAFLWKNPVIRVILMTVAVIGLFQTSSRASILGLVVAVIAIDSIYLMVTANTRAIIARFVGIGSLVSVIALVFVFAPALSYPTPNWDPLLRTSGLHDPTRGADSGFSGRVEVWSQILAIWQGNPLFGVGFRQHEALIERRMASPAHERPTTSHNAYLAMLVDTGVTGLLAYLALLAVFLHAGYRTITGGAFPRALFRIVVAYIVVGFFERNAINSGNAFSIIFMLAGFGLVFLADKQVARFGRAPIVRENIGRM